MTRRTGFRDFVIHPFVSFVLIHIALTPAGRDDRLLRLRRGILPGLINRAVSNWTAFSYNDDAAVTRALGSVPRSTISRFEHEDRSGSVWSKPCAITNVVPRTEAAAGRPGSSARSHCRGSTSPRPDQCSVLQNRPPAIDTRSAAPLTLDASLADYRVSPPETAVTRRSADAACLPISATCGRVGVPTFSPIVQSNMKFSCAPG